MGFACKQKNKKKKRNTEGPDYDADRGKIYSNSSDASHGCLDQNYLGYSVHTGTERRRLGVKQARIEAFPIWIEDFAFSVGKKYHAWHTWNQNVPASLLVHNGLPSFSHPLHSMARQSQAMHPWR